jgi:2-oxo-4-hydroxy-4-carboxy--5-ureidoimidazoline (OHCU) decarboxylase
MGKTGEQILAILKERLANTPGEEILVAKDEQHQITLTRLEKLIT